MQDNSKHLGHTIIGKVSGDIDIKCIIKSFNRSVNILLAEFGAVPSTILCRLFQSYCTSLYGIVLCKYSSCEFVRLCVAWRKAVRRILRIPRHSHNKLIPLLSGTPPIECMLKSRIFRFFTSLIKMRMFCVKLLLKDVCIRVFQIWVTTCHILLLMVIYVLIISVKIRIVSK